METAEQLYKERQKKYPKRRFVRKPLAPLEKRCLKPKVFVVKKYGRFNKEAKARGWLKNPVPQGEFFEVHDVTSGGVMSELSPMITGPVVDDREIIVGLNVEDAWQGLKVWPMHLKKGARFNKKAKDLWEWDPEAESYTEGLTEPWYQEWLKWSDHIRLSGEGKRHRAKVDTSRENPNVPLFSVYSGKKLLYVPARKVMYIPWYAKLVQETKAFQYLKERFDAGTSLVLKDPDGDPMDSPMEAETEERLKACIDDPKRIFGHGKVIASLLLGAPVWTEKH